MRMTSNYMVWTTALLLLAGCRGTSGNPAGAAPAARRQASAADGGVPYDTHLPLGEFMAHVMQHAGNGVWKWQGTVIDRTGERSLFPRNEEEWEDAESGALSLAEVTNLLLIPGRRIAEPGWDKAVTEVRRVALQAAKAAEKHDKDAFFEAGSALDEACDACHVRYDPNFKAAPG